MKHVRITYQKVGLILAFWCVLSISGPAAADTDSNRQAELLFLLKQDCGSCHGMTLKGGLGPALLPENLSTKNTAVLTQIILNGRPNLGMPAWKSLLSEQDAAWLAKKLVEGINGSN